MITHIVLFKLHDRSPESVEKARAVLASLEGKVPQLRHLEVGADVLHTDRSYDLALVAKFDSLEDLNAYQIHHEHQQVVKYMMSVRQSAVAVDYVGS
ncbi:MAG: Dabb family protein [Thermodesulfobacteriota bacterium]